MEFIKVCTKDELPHNSQKVVNLGKKKIALFHFNKKISAIANACLHKAGPLGLGAVSAKYDGMYVTCPWHGWEYNIETGSAPPGFPDQQALYERPPDPDPRHAVEHRYRCEHDPITEATAW